MKGSRRQFQNVVTSYQPPKAAQDDLHLLIAEHRALTGEILHLIREFQDHVSTLSALAKECSGVLQALPETGHVHD